MTSTTHANDVTEVDPSSDRPTEGGPIAPKRRGRSPVAIVAIVVAIAVAAVVLVLGFVAVRDLTRSEPQFPLLSEHPDPSLEGTVAYFSDRSRCVRLVAASGASSKDVLCLADQDVATAEKLGKEIGPQLVWLPDGRLEVTMFRMTDPPGPSFRAGWQKIVDVRTGQVEDVPASSVPSEPNRSTRPQVNAKGERIRTSSDPESGRIEVALDSSSGSRTLLSAQGPGNYMYGLGSAFWAPNEQWIAADDGRILVITPNDPSVTRVLTDETKSGAFGTDEPLISRFAVTSANLLAPGS